MKNIFLFLFISIFGLTFLGCDEELEVWDSEVLEYSGRYSVELLSEDMSATYYDYGYGMEVYVYNTADNVDDEVWFEDVYGDIPMKVKMFLEGTPSDFSSRSLQFDDLGVNSEYIDLPADAPAEANVSVTEDRSYIRAGIVEGKILTGAATSVGGNVADSVYVKVVLLSGTVTFKSQAVPEEEWADPNVEEFEWEQESMTYDPDLDETYVISGYRYTGMPEDH